MSETPEPRLERSLAPATVAIGAGRPPHEVDQPLNVPLTMASTYVADGAREYGRSGNPTWQAFEEALGALEGGRSVAFASGLAGISAVLDVLVPPGGVVVAPAHSYSGTLLQLRDRESSGRIGVRWVDVTDTAGVVAACDGAALAWMESPTNPALEVADLAAIVPAAHAAGARVVVDNTFATPILQRPLELDADAVVHSATKYIGGHSDLLMGAVAVPTGSDLHDALVARRSLAGSVPGTFEAWLALRGLRTLPLRMERASANAAELARRLADHPALAEVRYPGLGAIVSVVLAGGEAAADRFTRGTKIWVHTTSLGGVESTLERRRRWPAEAPTIPDALVRLSVGCEDVDDLFDDLVQALAASGLDTWES